MDQSASVTLRSYPQGAQPSSSQLWNQCSCSNLHDWPECFTRITDTKIAKRAGNYGFWGPSNLEICFGNSCRDLPSSQGWIYFSKSGVKVSFELNATTKNLHSQRMDCVTTTADLDQPHVLILSGQNLWFCKTPLTRQGIVSSKVLEYSESRASDDGSIRRVKVHEQIRDKVCSGLSFTRHKHLIKFYTANILRSPCFVLQYHQTFSLLPNFQKH